MPTWHCIVPSHVVGAIGIEVDWEGPSSMISVDQLIQAVERCCLYSASSTLNEGNVSNTWFFWMTSFVTICVLDRLFIVLLRITTFIFINVTLPPEGV